MERSRHQAAWRQRVTGILILAGIAVAVMAALELKVAWIGSLCGLFGGGCRDTAAYHLLRLPISFWGIGYYSALAVVYYGRPAWLYYGVMAGFGVEMALVRIMAAGRFLCLLCLLNLVLMLALTILLLERRRLAETLAVGLLFFVGAEALTTNAHTFKMPGARGPESADILARVGDQAITVEDVERSLTTRLYQMQHEIYRVKQQYLESRIDAVLLEVAAREQGITVEALTAALEAEVVLPGEEIVDDHYRSKRYKRWGDWQGSAEEIKARIRDALHAAAVDRHIRNHCRTLRDQYPVDVYLRPPPLPLTEVVIEGSPALGPPEAPVTVVEFSDYLCPACRRGHATVNRIRAEYKDKVRWVFKDFPLATHPGAGELALAARCAGAQGRFWEFQDRLYAGAEKPDLATARAHADALGLDRAQFDACLADPAVIGKLSRDIREAQEAGISATPTILINGRLRSGIPSFEEFSALIDAALAASDTPGG